MLSVAFAFLMSFSTASTNPCPVKVHVLDADTGKGVKGIEVAVYNGPSSHYETGFIAHGPFLELGSVRQKSGKVVQAWAFAGDCDPAQLVSNTCEIEWPPKSNRHIAIPEVDRGEWFQFADAAKFIREEQRPFLERLQGLLRS